MNSTTTREDIQPAGIEEDSAQDIYALRVLILLLRDRKFILWFTAGAAILAVIVVLLLPNKYTAETVLIPPAQNSSMSSILMSQLSGGAGALSSMAGAGLGIKNTGEIYVSLFRGRTVEDAVIQRFGLMAKYRKKRLSDARTEFEKNSSVILGVKDGMIRVSVADRDPKQAAEMANGYVEEFRKVSANLAITEASQRRQFFQQQLLEANENLAKAEVALKDTEQSTGILQIDSQARSLIESAAALRAQLVAKEVQLQAMRAYATEDNPEMVIAKQQLAALKEQLAQLGGAGSDPDSSANNDIVVPKGKIPEAGMEYIRKLRDVKYYETIMELIAKQFEAAKLDEARQGTVIQVADTAVAPDKKSSPHRAVIVILITIIGFVTAVLWVLAVARWRQKLRDPQRNADVQTLRGLLFQKQRSRAL